MDVGRVSFALVAAVALGLACAAKTPPVELIEGAEEVRTGKGDPTPDMEEVGAIEVVDGNGCTSLGKRGTFNRALIRLKNKAASMQADYVQIFTITEPHQARSNCYDMRFIIRGIAFRKSGEAETTAAATDR